MYKIYKSTYFIFNIYITINIDRCEFIRNYFFVIHELVIAVKRKIIIMLHYV